MTGFFESLENNFLISNNEPNPGGWFKAVLPKAFVVRCAKHKIPYYSASFKGYDLNAKDGEKSFLTALTKEFDLKLVGNSLGESDYFYDDDEETADALENNIDSVYAKYGHDNQIEMIISYFCSLSKLKTYVSVITTNKAHVDRITELQKSLNKTKPEKDNKGKINVLTSGYDGLSTQELTMAAVPLVLDNYNQTTQDGIACVVSELNSALPTGRLIILEGNPGTGKTFLVRSLIGQVKAATFIIVPSGMVGKLADPSIIPVFLEFKKKKIPSEEKLIQSMSDGTTQDTQKAAPIVLVIEDADQCLLSRNSGNLETISTILNLTSGILGDAIDIRIVATTNSKITELDSAILRDGRMSTYVEVGNLSQDEANRVYRRLLKDNTVEFHMNEKELKDGVPLAKVYKTAKTHAKGTSVKSDGNNELSNRFVSNNPSKKSKIGFQP